MPNSPIWQKSSFSGPDENQSCVELADHDGLIKMRESDVPGTVLSTTPERLRALMHRVKADGFDRLT
ncbi:DUF397 domain-containing protein [Streptomyces sp. NPDC057654]|uniref:DUF397 domain-containing protein n=1 Tax=Streptomyces sp. NPDC057654 TaxID=3346196 RepID=UPI0036979118